jgi:hypothetical protein
LFVFAVEGVTAGKGGLFRFLGGILLGGRVGNRD